MRKLFVIMLLLLVICIPAAADRIAPTVDIGLFVDPKGFTDGLNMTPLKDHIQGIDSRAYTFNSDLITRIMDYKLEDDTLIRCWINRYGKIHAIRIIIDPIYSYQDYCFEDYELTEFVLQSAGLILSDDDSAAITAVRNNEKNYLARNFSVKRYTDDINLNIDIDSIYMSGPGRDPYNLMDEVFAGKVCDPNYIGACIPLVERQERRVL